ncbi:Sec-independent protein translocase protein TatB [Sneathiella sp. HT1-7]|uniref:Sec-independent protein translocase protein TatB n=1 Tax=Sneathiella sp. HT1-7 TaxID=2887192 RepID=UPI001D13830E|nr:Sec-independent protein translocase protein TatB [Sneathiella sp. HT1-7]MCC3304997.1 Sec-independent protein translocase protein TatB [Sneathiella sp. HT1-7]
MFDIGWTEMAFVLVIAVLVIGPKDLPKAISTIGKYVRKARSMARDFQSGIDDLARETELDEIKKDIQKGTDFNIKKQIEDAVDPTGSKENMFNDIKPQIRDPRDSANNYSAPPVKSGEGTQSPAKADAPSVAEKPAPAKPAEPAPVKTADAPPVPKSETKAS